MQLVDLFPCDGQRFFAGSGDPIDSPPTPAGALLLRLEQSASLQAMQQRIERAGTDAVAVVRQLLHHGQAEDRLVRGMHQHMDPNQAEKEVSLIFGHPSTILLGEIFI